MKRRIMIVSAILMMLCLLFCAAGAEETGSPDELYPKQEENGLWGYSDAAGNWVIPAQFFFADDFRGSYACVDVQKEDGVGSGIINRKGEFVLQPEYYIDDGRDGYLKGYGTWDDGYYIVNREDAPEGFFDVRSGSFSGLKYEHVLETDYECELIPVCQTRDGIDYMGFADRATGELVLPYEYWISSRHAVVEAFPEGVGVLASVAGIKENWKWDWDKTIPGDYVLMKQNGEVIQLPDGIVPDDIGIMSEGLITVRDEKTGLYGYADINGNIVIRPEFYEAYTFYKGKAEVELTEDCYAIIDREGKILLREEDEQFPITMTENDGTGIPRYAFRGINGLYGFIDEQGKVVMPPQFAYAEDFCGEYAEVEEFSNVLGCSMGGVIDANGRWKVYPEKHAEVRECIADDHGGIYILRREESYGYLDVATGCFSGYVYDDIRAERDISVLIPVTKDGKTGYVERKTGEIRIPCRYDPERTYGFENGYAVAAYADGELLLIDENGKEIIPPDGTMIDPGDYFADGLCPVWDRETWLYGYMNPDGQMAIPLMYRNASCFEDGAAQALTEDGWIYIDPNGNRLPEEDPENTGTEDESWPSDAVYWISTSDEQGVFWYGMDDSDLAGLMNAQGDLLTEPMFRWIEQEGNDDEYFLDFHEGLCAVIDDATGLCGYIDVNGNWAVQPLYKKVESFANGTAWVSQDRPAPFGEYGRVINERKLISKTGEVLFAETVPDTKTYRYDYHHEPEYDFEAND
ncbi:MAG: WG repeat-containing protein [Clostridia bacterium]|nr:WG repeat-containing protein [Clostridia bacterium]